MFSIARGAIGAALFASTLFAASASAALVSGPTYPLPNGTGQVSQSGTIGRSGGATWAFSGATPTAQQSLWWAPAPNGVQLSFNNNSYANPGETLTFNSAQSNLGSGVIVYTGQTNFQDGAQVLTRFTMVYKVGNNPVALVASSTLGLDAGTIGAVLPLTSPASGFTVNMEFDVIDTSSGGGYAPALDIYDNHYLNNHECCGSTAFSSVTGGYYVDTPPKITGITPSSLVTQKNSVSSNVNFAVSDVDTAATTLTVTAVSSNTAVISNANISLTGTGVSRSVKVTSTATTGTTNITLTVSDGLLSSTAVLPVRVNAIPILSPNSPLGVNQGGTVTVTNANLGATDPDTATAPTFVIGFLPHDGKLFLNGVADPSSFTQTDINSGGVTYTQDNSCSTGDNFSFTVRDVDGGYANDPSQGSGPTSYNFNFNVTLAQTAPTAQSASYSLALGGTLNKTLLATSGDCSNPAITYQVATGPAGTLSIDAATGNFTYTANAGFSGTDSFTYTATTYGSMVSAPATITVDVEEQAPVANNATINPDEGVAISGTLTATDANLPALALTYALGATSPTKGSVVLNDAITGSYTYTPTAGQIGQDSFTFTASNGTLTSAEATITIDIRGKLHSGAFVISDDGDNTHPGVDRPV